MLFGLMADTGLMKTIMKISACFYLCKKKIQNFTIMPFILGLSATP